MLKALQTSLRDSALVWFKDQLKFISLNSFKTIIAKTFSSVVLTKINLNSTIINSSSRFHSCSECVAQFSSISRLLVHAQKNCNKIFTCKHCELKFNSNNKLHEYIRLNHNKMLIKTLRQRFVEEKNKHINLLVTSTFVTTLVNSVTLFTSSITFRSMLASTTFLNLSNSMMQAQATCSFSSSIDFFNTSTNLAASAVSTALIICSKLASDHKSLAIFNSKTLSVRSKFDYFTTFSTAFKSTSTLSKSSHHSLIMMKASIKCFSTFSSTSFQTSMFSHQKSLESYMIMKNLFAMFAKEKRFKKSLNIIHKRIRSSMFDQTQIINYFKSVDQSNFTSIISFKSSSLINSLCSTLQSCSSVNRAAKTSQYQHIAIDHISNLENKSKIKMQSFKQKYFVDVDVTHTNINIRVETSLTKAKKYNLIKTSIKSFKSVNLLKKLKSSIYIDESNSTSRVCLSINQDVRTSHIALDKIMSLTSSESIKSVKLIKSLKSVVFVNSLCSTLRFSLSVNHDLVTSQTLIAISSLLQALRALIKQLIRVFVVFEQRYLVDVGVFIDI